jgi:hypothetical protein
MGAAPQVNGLEARQVAKGIWEPLQMGAVAQANGLEARQVAKGIWQRLDL